MDITLVIYDMKASLEVLSEGKLLVDVSLAWFPMDSSDTLLGAGPLPVIFWLVVYPLIFVRAVLLTPPILFSILGLIAHSIFCLFQHPWWEA